MAAIRPFKAHIDDEALADLRLRLERTRWPTDFDDPDWVFGANVPYLRELIDYWRTDFSWRDAEARINSLDQFLLELDGLDVHFIHQRSSHPNARPLLLTHGWPGSVVEFLDAVPRLTQPELYGGTPDEAFHVVCPSLPGYGFSPPSTAAGMHPRKIADRHNRLMLALGYDRYLAQGGDWGASISQLTSIVAPENCRAILINLLVVGPPKGAADPMAQVLEHEKAWLTDNTYVVRNGMGYFNLQSTRPETAAVALTDSPAGLCAWIAEKFHFWSDCERDGQRDIRNAVSWDALLTNVSLYWFSNTIASSMRLYKDNALARDEVTIKGKLPVPLGVTIYPGEIAKTPRAWAAQRGDIIHWHEAAKGGHFAAMEQPQLFAEDVRRFAQQAVAALDAP